MTTASNWYFSNHSDARTNYDKDGDGYLDSVMLIYGAPDYLTAENSNTNLWAYCYWIQNSSAQNASNPGANVFFWASYDFMYSSTKAYQRTGKSNYGGGDTSYCSLDTHTYDEYGVYHVQSNAYNENFYRISVDLNLTNKTCDIHEPVSYNTTLSSSPYRNYSEDAGVKAILDKYKNKYEFAYEVSGYNETTRYSLIQPPPYC